MINTGWVQLVQLHSLQSAPAESPRLHDILHQDASGGNLAKLSLSDGKWFCASYASLLMLGKGMKPTSTDNDMRTELGPAAAQIAVCVPGSQALVPDIVCAGRMRNPP